MNFRIFLESQWLPWTNCGENHMSNCIVRTKKMQFLRLVYVLLLYIGYVKIRFNNVLPNLVN